MKGSTGVFPWNPIHDAVRFLGILLVLLQAACGLARAGTPGKSEERAAGQAFVRFCADLATAAGIHVDGPAGDALLEQCLFARARPPAGCARDLGTTQQTLRRVRANRAYFAVAGSPMIGLRLWLSHKRLKEIAQVAAQSPYVELIRLRLDIEETADKLGVKRFLQESSRREKEGRAPFQWGGVPPRVEPSDLVNLQVSYVNLLENTLQREQAKQIRLCLLGQLKDFRSAYEQSAEGKLRTELEKAAEAMGPEVIRQLDLSGGWRFLVFQVDRLCCWRGSPIGVVLLFENRAQHKLEEFMDERIRIFPWFELAVVDPAFPRNPAPCPKQPVISAEPAQDRRAFELLGQGRGFQLYYRTGMLPLFRDDSDRLPDQLRASAGLAP